MNKIDPDNLNETLSERSKQVLKKRLVSTVLGPVGADAYDIFVVQPSHQRVNAWREQVSEILNELIDSGIISDPDAPEAHSFFNALSACASEAALAFVPEKQKAFRKLIKSSAISSAEIEAEEIEHMVEILRRTTGIHYAILQSLNLSYTNLGLKKLPSSFPNNHPEYAQKRYLVMRALSDLDSLHLTEHYWLHKNTATGEETVQQPPLPDGPNPSPWSSERCRRISEFGQRFCTFALG
jgi:hypothetical protein